ncbi:glycosyltransferase [Dichotomopilus funicola]|uniref:Dol-P-Glc:Glc(2)Man(9)GlcNAc(2)-PP-Dol alpha-1,2-glucosyltransferase n=1 Tax=Dichotomopilus funicola TaxID=1934379 RepID=A0AAN6UW08_9PEZI|nr:glycosyltransferase [Dichotomopilus funicola]
MDPIDAIRQGLNPGNLFICLGVSYLLARYLAPSWLDAGGFTTGPPQTRVQVILTTGLFFLTLASTLWLNLVDKFVPEPYLDEVFHIPQAQTYCDGRFWDWDDKITTPPGLYFLSVALHRLGQSEKCDPRALRSANSLAAVLIAVVAAQCKHLVEVRAAERQGTKVSHGLSFNAFYTGLNIALFPVIFFFSGLYYTDVVSTLTVLVAYQNHLQRVGPRPPGLINDVWTALLGVMALFTRQTNVFWLVVYMGGLETAHILRSIEASPLVKLHDPSLNRSGPEDWFLCTVTLAFAAIANPLRVVRQIWPHITVLGLFAGFVAWNGGVVLGDKSNHIATIHLAQMLYIWPLFAFFSAPLAIPSILFGLTRPIQYTKSHVHLTSARNALTSIPYLLLTLAVSLAVVQYNTIIHPFTLADNRHYMFYVFRYTILRSPAIRLGLIAAYTASRWLMWDQLAGISHGPTVTEEATPSSALTDEKAQQQTKSSNQQPDAEPNPLPWLTTTSTSHVASTIPPQTSTALLWLLTTSLSLITAPLVEPRYFILPWVFYRLLVPAWSISGPAPTGNGSAAGKESSSRKADTRAMGSGPLAWVRGVGAKVDVRLVVETAWFVGINVVTMYVFLARGFYWKGPDGELLDEGRVQRFMW